MQCKWKTLNRFLTAEELRKEVAEALTFELEIGNFFVLTTSKRSTELQRELIQINQEHKRKGKFSVTLCTWESIEEFLRNNPNAWAQYIDPPIKHALAPIGRDIRYLSDKIEKVAASSSEDQIEQQLASARSYLDQNKYVMARVILRQVEQNHWNDLSEDQKFLTFTYLGQVALQGGNWNEAGRRFLDAKRFQTESERSLINEALGYELVGNQTQAYRPCGR